MFLSRYICNHLNQTVKPIFQEAAQSGVEFQVVLLLCGGNGVVETLSHPAGVGFC